MNKPIYNYDLLSGEFLSESNADVSPLESEVFLIPAHATEIAPPVAGVGERAVFDVATETWSLITLPQPVPVLPPTPEEIKATQWNEIKAERSRRNRGGYKVDTKWFHSDADSRIQQLGLVMMGANIPLGLQWKTMDGSFVAMTPALAQQVFTAAAASDQAIYAAAETHKAAMEASADPASYDFSTGWPLTFGE